ncbi:MAG: hypothetical protein DME22_06550 [Verrucomicrobia bacterium]|nr:MAG: hypothetical protein DME22_06550 [Verrucomicrobiota bacterium]PYK01836.1 MAG: hypothetical protein DME23_03195 [Verrucomicrobiota bacterium]
MTKFKIILISAFAIGGVTASLMIHDQAKAKLHENDAVLRQQDDQLAVLATEHQRLSNLVAQANSSSAEDQMVELAKLRSQAEALRKQTNELATQLAENRRSRPWQAASSSDTSRRFIGAVSVVSDSSSEEYREQLDRMTDTDGKLSDVRDLSSAIRKYAREHQGEFPANFDQAAPYYTKVEIAFPVSANSTNVRVADLVHRRTAPMTGTSKFEMVYQGSYNELTNVPWQEVALIRERQAWPTPSGKWAKIYVMASGEVNVVEADDNFQSWEAEHIIPPPSASQ